MSPDQKKRSQKKLEEKVKAYLLDQLQMPLEGKKMIDLCHANQGREWRWG